MTLRGWSLVLILWVVANVAAAHDFGGGSTNDPPYDPPPDGCPSGMCCRGGGGTGGGPGFGGAGVGDPVWAYNGSLQLQYNDLEIGTAFPIRLSRRYDSRSEYDTALGYGWAFDHDRRLFKYPDGSVIIRSGCGRRDHFVLTGGAFVTPRDGLQGTLEELANGHFIYRYADGRRDEYDADGRLISTENRAGQRHEFLYDPRGRLPLIGTSPRSVNPDQPMVVAYQPHLVRIQERSANGALTGHAVELEYNDTTGRLTRIVASDGREILYGHDEAAGATRGNLRTVAGSDNYVQGFGYTDANDPHRLTAIIDGVDAAPVVNTYDAQGRVVRQTHGGSTIDLAYLSPGRTQVTEIVTDANGAELQRRVSLREFDEAGYLTRETNPAGHEQRYFYNASKDRIRTELWERQADGTLALLKAVDNTYNGQAQKLTESVTLDSGETITTTWSYDHGWLASEETVSGASPQQVFRTEYAFVRDPAGVPVNIAAIKRRRDDGSFAVTAYSYCSAAEAAAAGSTCPDTGLLKVIDGPRTDISDVTTLSYYGSTNTSGCAQASGPCYHLGDLRRVSNALGQATEYLRYDAAGRATRVRDANGIVGEFRYHPRGWLLEQAMRGPDDAVTTDDAITSYRYDPRGNLIRQTQPDGAYLAFTYDARNRLVEIADVSGGRIRYTLDSIGNRLKEETFDAGGTLRRTLSRGFDLLDRLATETDAAEQKTAFDYDAGGRQTDLIDARGVRTSQIYDDLDRLVRTVADAGSGGLQVTTQFRYDAAGNLRQVIDPKGLPTNYHYNTLGQLLQLDSPDTGTTSYSYDLAGNRTQQTDARGETAAYTFDALNRLTAIGYSDSAFDVSYRYDAVPSSCTADETYAQGRLSVMTDHSGSTQYCYDRFGRIVRKVQLTGTSTLAVRYVYGPAHRLQAVIYPDSTVVDYGRDTQGRVAEVGVTAAGEPRQLLLTGASYYPFGPAAGWDYGSGRQLSRQYDLDYRPQRIHDPMSGGLDLGFGFDPAGNLARLHTADLAELPLAQFDYDPLNRLTHFRDGATGAAIEAYRYDATGNRLERANANGAQAYSYPADSHRLQAVAGVARSYDATGNTVAIGGTARQYRYAPNGRLIRAERNGTISATYQYNGRGEQVLRDTPASAIRFVYNEAGQLLGQYHADGRPLQQYVWMDDLPVGVIVDGRLYAVEPDHLGTPRSIIDPQRQTAIWTWDLRSEAFGSSPPSTDPDGDGSAFVYDLRFPGQRYDMASGLDYNYFRDYEADIGRYVQSDPIGLWGGANTYNYSYDSPLIWFDPTGLSGKQARNFSPGRGGNSAQRRKATRDYMHGAEGQPPPNLAAKRPGNDTPASQASTNQLSPYEAACAQVAAFGVDICGPGPRMAQRCVRYECFTPTNECTSENPTGNPWRNPGPIMHGPDYSIANDPRCRCARYVYYDKY